MHANDGRQSAIVSVGITERLTCIMDAVVCMQESVDNALGSLEDSAVLVQDGHFYRLRHILELHKIFGEVGAEVLQPITVVIDKPARFTI